MRRARTLIPTASRKGELLMPQLVSLTRLGKPELAGELEKLSRQAKPPREVEWLSAVSIAMSGDFTLGQIA